MMSRFLLRGPALAAIVMLAACSSSDDAAVISDEDKCEPLKQEAAAYEQCKEQFGLE
jgi:hypothetical protein